MINTVNSPPDRVRLLVRESKPYPNPLFSHFSTVFGNIEFSLTLVNSSWPSKLLPFEMSEMCPSRNLVWFWRNSWSLTTFFYMGTEGFTSLSSISLFLWNLHEFHLVFFDLYFSKAILGRSVIPLSYFQWNNDLSVIWIVLLVSLEESLKHVLSDWGVWLYLFNLNSRA